MDDTKAVAAWKAIADTPNGRIALSYLFETCGLYSELAPATGEEAHRMIGERNVAVRIANWIGRKQESFVRDAEEDGTLVERMMETRSGDYF